MDELLFTQILLLVGAGIKGLIGTVLAVRIGVSLNLVELFQYRRKILEGRIQNICPHATVVKTSSGYGIQSYFHSPSGTLDYVCRRCQRVVQHRAHVVEIVSSWANDLEGLIKREEKFEREVGKFYKV